MSSRIGIMQGRLSRPINNRIQSFPLNSWEDEFYLAKEIGFELIEWVLDENIQDNPILNKKHFSKINFIKNETGININSICCDYFMKNSLSKNSKSFSEKNLEIMNFLIEESCPLNNIKIIDLPLVGEESLKKKKISEDYKNVLLKLEKKILGNNLMVALETDLGPNELKDFLKNFNKNAVTVNYDMGNSAFWEFEAKKEFLSYGKLISNVHIKDCTPRDYTVQLGDGNVNFDEIFLLLKKNNYKADFILQAARGENDFQIAKKQFQFAKKYVEKFCL
jgi:hexulose-6-phosphate isomerase|tara:strand:- start:2526 stop:3359 length:834 start_codon:yes stop_codon:yes gene_type:complete